MCGRASEALGLSPAECAFVDVDPRLVAGVRLGYAGFVVDRCGGGGAGDVAAATTLAEVLTVIET